MKYYTLALSLIPVLSSCKSGNTPLLNSSDEYWEVYSINHCYRISSKKPFKFERWVFNQSTYDLYAFHRDGSIHPESRSGRDFEIDQSWQLRNDSLILDGELKRFAIRRISNDSLILSRSNATCISYRGANRALYQVEEIYAMARRKGDPLL